MNIKTIICNFLASVFLVVLAAAITSAQQAFKYGVEYMCGKERIVVQYCRNDSGTPVGELDNYCMVEYPDRPRRMPEIAVFASVLKSEMTATLTACGAITAGASKSSIAGSSSSDPDTAKARAAKVDTTILGMQFGEPLRLPFCPLLQVMAPTQNCISQAAELSKEIGRQYGTESTVPDDMKIIMLAEASCPAWVNECTAYVTVHNGKLDGVAVYTKGRNSVNAVTSDLTTKYGKPTTVKPRKFQPDNGNAFSYNEPSWTLPGLRVGYEVLFSENDDDRASSKIGIVRIMTESEHQRRLAKEKTIVKPKL